MNAHSDFLEAALSSSVHAGRFSLRVARGGERGKRAQTLGRRGHLRHLLVREIKRAILDGKPPQDALGGAVHR